MCIRDRFIARRPQGAGGGIFRRFISISWLSSVLFLSYGYVPAFRPRNGRYIFQVVDLCQDWDARAGGLTSSSCRSRYRSRRVTRDSISNVLGFMRGLISSPPIYHHKDALGKTAILLWISSFEIVEVLIRIVWGG